MKQCIKGFTKLTVVSVLVTSLIACGGAEERKMKYLEKGKSYLAEKNYDKARIEIKNVIQIDPKSSEAYYLMGNIEEKNKELAKALANYKKAIELTPDYVDAKVKLARLYVVVNTQEYIDNAKLLLDEVNKVDPDNSEAALISATIEYKTGNKENAIKDLESIVKNNPNLVDGIGLLSSIYTYNKEYEKAISLLTKGAEDNVDSIAIRISLAKLLAAKNDLQGAEKYLLEAQKIEPENFTLGVALSSFYTSSGQLDKAEKVLRDEIAKDPEDSKRYLMLVDFLASAKSLKSAEEEMQKIVDANPELYDLKFSQVVFYEKISDKDKAKSILENIAKEREYDVEGVKARVMLSNYLLEEGDTEGASSYIDLVLKEYPTNSDALLVAGKLALADFDAISAINNLRTVVKNDPKNTDATLLLAKAHELNNESSLAEAELKKAIEANPTNVKTHINYASYIASKGRADEAIDSIDKALTYFKDSYELLELKLKLIAPKGDEAQITDLLDMMQRTNASRFEPYMAKGQYYLSKKDFSSAIDMFEKAYSRANNKLAPLENIVKAHLMNNQPQEAIKRLDKRLSENSDDVIAQFLKAKVFISQKKYSEAEQQLKSVIKHSSKWFLPYSLLGSMYLSQNNVDGAISIYKEAESNLVNKIPAQMQMATIYQKENRIPEAMSEYEKILKTNSTNKIAANNLASMLLDYGKPSDVERALQLSRDFEKLGQLAFNDTLAWAYSKSGNHLKAIELLKPIVEKVPDAAVIQYHIGYALYYSGDKEAARSHLEIAVNSDQMYPGKEKARELLDSI